MEMLEKTNEIFQKCLDAGLLPRCLYCEHSIPEEIGSLRCKKNMMYENQTINYMKNFFKVSCEFFDPDEYSIICMMREKAKK